MPMGSLQDVTQFIQLAVAPVFLLTGLAATMTIFTNRLSRVVDRGRFLEGKPAPISKDDREELFSLEKRAQLIYRALLFGVTAALCVCLLMTIAFAGEIFRWNTSRIVATLFMLALFSYTAALLCLLREVFLAITNFSLGIHHVSPK